MMYRTVRLLLLGGLWATCLVTLGGGPLGCAPKGASVGIKTVLLSPALDEGPPDFVLVAECEEGKAASCTALGRRYEAAMEQACTRGAFSACDAIIEASRGGSQMANPTEARAAYQRACGRGHAPGCEAAKLALAADPNAPRCAGVSLRLRVAREGLTVLGADAFLHPAARSCGVGAGPACPPDLTCAGPNGCLQPSAKEWVAMAGTLGKVRQACPTVESLTLFVVDEVPASTLREAASRLAGGEQPVFKDIFVEGAP